MPYWNTKNVFPCMYAGTINTKKNTDHNLFYWMFKNLESSSLPLAVWLNGGPGAASMFGLFLENGPLRINKTGPTDDDYLMYLNPEGSWVDVANMIFLDQPIGTGFSYGDPLLTKMQDGADEFVNFMLGIYDIHPEFKTRPFYITGESYAGKYIPIFAETIINYNEQQVASGGFQIPLAGVMIGDPFNSPPQQRVRMPVVPRGLNIIDDSQMEQIDSLQRNCEESLVSNPEERADLCGTIMSYIEEASGGLLEYDARIFNYDWNPIEDVVNNFLNTCTQKDEFY